MPRNEEGEFELVLGNRQLLSVFFIVVVLLGVFFVMGYILGKNSSPTTTTEVTNASKPAETGLEPSPIIIDKRASKSSAAGEPAAEKPVAVNKPVAKAEATKTEPIKADPKPEVKVAPASGDTRTGEPPKGSFFLQVAAVGRAEADVVAKILRGKGHAMWIAPSDKEKIFRVLVGQIQKSDQGKVRGELDALGFKPFPRSY